MKLTLFNPQFFYQFFYSLAFVFMFCLVLYKSLKRGYHLRSVLLMLTTISLCTVIGTRIFTIPIEDWSAALQLKAPEFNNRSSIGGLLFGLIGLIISTRIFRFKRPMLDLFTWLVPVAIGITKLGCLYNGCCYGLPFNGFWGIQYPVGTHGHFNHWVSGAIGNSDKLSLSMHPVQLYETLLLFIIGYIIWKTHKKWRKNGSAMLFALCLIFSLRFGVEFFRDHSVSHFSTTHYLGIWSIQWGMLGIGLILGVILWFYEKHFRLTITKSFPKILYIHAEFIYIIILAFFIYVFRNLLVAFELRVVWIMFIPAIIMSFYYLFTEVRLRNHRKLVALWLLTPFYVLAQTIPDQTPVIKKYKRIDIGGSFGDFSNTIKYNPQQVVAQQGQPQTLGGCGPATGTTYTTAYSYEFFKESYQVGGAGYSQVIIKGNKINTYGVNISGGSIKRTNLSTNYSESEFIYAINPYAKWDWKWLGVGVGFQLGKLRVNKNETITIGEETIAIDNENLDDLTKHHTFLPEFHIRVGPKKYLDIDYNYGFIMPSAYPTLYSRSSIGSAFGLSQDYSLRFGQIWNLKTGYMSAEALLTNKIGVNLMYVFKKTNNEIDKDDISGKFLFSLNYRFGHQQK
ncbi:prolipoprotein diacylglyceryl transferase family protein [Cognatitamlana onchidii]|uniref:prolipoprotein diacylglyceryl transferase family protein n=1 Tax=Cognatitamlana onchidii TaxID=2562860 RepID=UPI0010A5D104|nr:prolipoprotein diacylglyceryl transferase family protein [Algibacter onchidii]